MQKRGKVAMAFWRNSKLKIIVAVFLLLACLVFVPGCSVKKKQAEDLSVLPEFEEETALDSALQEEEDNGDDEPELSKEEPASVPESAPEEEVVETAPEPKTETPAEGLTIPVIEDGDYLLALVSKNTILKSDYVPSGLMPVPSYMNPSYSMQLRDVALQNLELLFSAAAYDGVNLSIRSAYRSYHTQDGLFKDYALRHGEEEANRFSARPGQSEHQLGTTVDFGGTAVDFSAAFADTPQGVWLAKNAVCFGFAMSYPEGKEQITGYIFEPWHFRYIGLEEALKWQASGITLVEYLETKPQAYDY